MLIWNLMIMEYFFYHLHELLFEKKVIPHRMRKVGPAFLGRHSFSTSSISWKQYNVNPCSRFDTISPFQKLLWKCYRNGLCPSYTQRQISIFWQFYYNLGTFCLHVVLALYSSSFVLFLLWENLGQIKKNPSQIVYKMSRNCRQIVICLCV